MPSVQTATTKSPCRGINLVHVTVFVSRGQGVFLNLGCWLVVGRSQRKKLSSRLLTFYKSGVDFAKQVKGREDKKLPPLWKKI